MPCLNEVRSLEPCILAIREALAAIEARFSLNGEIIVADNGSTDGSQALARQLGARVVDVSAKGYGAALQGGCGAALGRYLVMGDADGSYDFREATAMIGALEALKVSHGEPMPPQMQAFGINTGDGGKLLRLFATHPPLDQRIAALRAQGT